MIKWPITYTDFNGEEQTDEFYFNLTQAELVELNLQYNGAFTNYLQGIIDARDGKELARVFKMMLTMSYGEKSPDGRSFMKNDDIRNRWICSSAYDAMYMEILQDTDKLNKFISGVLPKVENNRQNVAPVKK